MENEPEAKCVAGYGQFSLKSVFAITALVAVVYSLLLSSPEWLRESTFRVSLFAMVAVWLMMVIFGRGYVRAFGLGALCLGTGLSLSIGVFVGYLVSDRDGSFLVAFITWLPEDRGRFFALMLSLYLAGNVVSGILAIAVRWMIKSARHG